MRRSSPKWPTIRRGPPSCCVILAPRSSPAFGCARLYDGSFNPPVLDFKLTVEPVTFAAMRAFVRKHHAHCAPPICWRFGGSDLQRTDTRGRLLQSVSVKLKRPNSSNLICMSL